MERRYRALRIIGTIYKVCGGIVGIITILIAVALCALSAMGGAGADTIARDLGRDTGLSGLLSGVVGGAILSALAILYGGGLAITLYAAGEAVYLLLALEENTRATAMALQQRSAEPPPEA